MWLYDINKDYSKYTKKLVMIIADKDKIYRGHLLNIYPPVCFDDPKKFVPRYLSGFKLIPIFIKYLYTKKEKK